MPALLQHMSGLVDGFDVASAVEMRHALDTAMPAEQISFAGPGQDRRRVDGRRGRGRHDRVGVGDRARARRGPSASGSASGRGSPCGSTPTSQLKGSGMRMGGGPQQFGVDAEQVPALLAAAGRADLDFRGFHIFAGSQNLDAESIVRGPAQHRRAGARTGRRGPGTGALPEPRRRLRHPLLRRDQPLDLGAIGANLAELIGDADPAAAARRAGRDRTRPLPGRRGGRLRDPRGRPQGVARHDLPGHRRRPAPPVGRVGQLRPGDPAQLSGRDRQPRRRPADETVSVVGCLCTPLDLLADGVIAARGPRSATWSCCSRPAPTG